MDTLISTVIICEENKTRAELYALWLDSYDVRIAVTERQANEKLTGTTAVAIIDEEFCDGAATAVHETIQSETAVCRVIAMRDRDAECERLVVDHELVTPIFQDELSELVETLLRRSNYHFALKLYYQTTLRLSTLEANPEQSQPEKSERYEQLQQRAERLQPLIVAFRQQLTQDDIISIRQDVTSNYVVADPEDTEKVDSKYRPTSCSRCEEHWNQSSDRSNVTQIGAYVWRCGNCGHVQMGADPSHQNIY